MRKVYKKPVTVIIMQTGDILTSSNELERVGITVGTVNGRVNHTVNGNF